MARQSKYGPGFLVAAAFIGPGTVTTATLAGAYKNTVFQNFLFVLAFMVILLINLIKFI